MKVLLYCTMAKPYLTMETDFVPYKRFYLSNKDYGCLNGKIVAECDFIYGEIFTTDYRGNVNQNERISKDSCLSFSDLINYQGDNQFLYALHLKNVEVFDRPYNLNEWFNEEEKELTKAPQNMCYCYHWLGDKYILISIQPQHLCKILNGEKTIEIRRKILNCMKELILNEKES